MVALKDMRILISGVQGQVGFELVKILGLTGAELILGARRLPGSTFMGWKAVTFDLQDEAGLRQTLRSVRPHLVIHPAAYTAVDKAESEPELAFQANSRSVKAMAEELQALGSGLIHFSTDYIYNPAHEHCIEEQDPKNPGNVYAASKWEGEQALFASDLPFITLRTSWVYGIQGQNFIKTMLRLGRERERLSIVADQVGSPTSALTLAQAVYAILLQQPAEPLELIARKRGAYNVSDRGETHWQAFALEIFARARELNWDLKVQTVEPILTSAYKTAASRPLNSRLSLSKIEREFAFYPQAWDISLREFLYQASLGL